MSRKASTTSFQLRRAANPVDGPLFDATTRETLSGRQAVRMLCCALRLHGSVSRAWLAWEEWRSCWFGLTPYVCWSGLGSHRGGAGYADHTATMAVCRPRPWDREQERAAWVVVDQGAMVQSPTTPNPVCLAIAFSLFCFTITTLRTLHA